MNKRFTKNYLKIYIWQIISVVLNFASLFIVVPKLSVNPSLYGIYSLCLSFVVFFSYADLGFLSAGYKYASEYFAKAQKEEEIKITAFVGFILLVLTLFFSSGILYLSFNVDLLFKNISIDNSAIAHKLLLILSISSPFIVCQRIVQLVFGVRLMDYLFQQMNVIGNIIKLLGVFLFFPSNSNGNIVGYFLFIQCIGVFATIMSVFLANIKFDYNFRFFLRHFKFDIALFNKTKSLAFGSLLLTVSWILYYELDLLAISKLLGAPLAATYAIGLTILSLFRSMYSILFNPFNARFNHLKGIHDIEGLKKMLVSIINLSIPVFLFPIFMISFLSKHLIHVWLGAEYVNSISIVQILVFCNILGFISYPSGILIIVLEKYKLLSKIGIFMPILYWAIIFGLKDEFALQIFPIAKLLVFTLMGLFYSKFIFKFIGSKSFFSFLKSIIIALFIVALIYLIIQKSIGLFPTVKNYFNLFYFILYFGLINILAFTLYFFSNTNFKNLSKTLITK